MVRITMYCALFLVSCLVVGAQEKPATVSFKKELPKADEAITIRDLQRSQTKVVIGGDDKGGSMTVNGVSSYTAHYSLKVMNVDSKGAAKIRAHFKTKERSAEDDFMPRTTKPHAIAQKTYDLRLEKDATTILQEDGLPTPLANTAAIKSDLDAVFSPRSLHRMIPDRAIRIGERLEIDTKEAQAFLGTISALDGATIDSCVLSLTLTEVKTAPAPAPKVARFSVKTTIGAHVMMDGLRVHTNLELDGHADVDLTRTNLLQVELRGMQSFASMPGNEKGGSVSGSGSLSICRRVIYLR